VIVAAYLYYRCDSPIVSDGAYDHLSNFVAETWDFLDPVRQWQCGSAQEIAAGGSHILITQMGESCARARHLKKFGCLPAVGPITEWKMSPFGFLYSSLTG
jgi:hypothetical protein